MPTAVEYDRIEPGVHYDPQTRTLYVEPHRVRGLIAAARGSNFSAIFAEVVETFQAAYPERPVDFAVWVTTRKRLPRFRWFDAEEKGERK